jgi:hypothetical protein
MNGSLVITFLVRRENKNKIKNGGEKIGRKKKQHNETNKKKKK